MFGFGSRKDINAYVPQARMTEGAVLLDVRSADECARAHIAGTFNVPLPELARGREVIPDFNTPIFAFCLSGGRSAQAVKELEAMGYLDVTNIGGMRFWTGPVVQGVE